IYTLAKTKTVILISHRLANVVKSDNIYVLDKGNAVEQGSHEQLLHANGYYAKLWNTQQNIENYGKDGAAL
ncbi:MAG: cysteine ABC transporter ATP-binding protein, partial [Eubacterium sp.]|nr:cysteine ABC transporter ATP-binding protein [Eubacterium sp.]